MITSRNNKKIKYVNSLKNRKNREKDEVFIIEGEKVLDEYIDKIQIKDIYITEEYKNKYSEAILVSDEVFEKISNTKNPQGVLAICKQLEYDLDIVNRKENGTFILLEEISDPGNLGTIIRTADAAGIDAIFISSKSVDLYNSKVIRATMGSIFNIPIFTNIEIKDVINDLNCDVLALDLEGSQNIYEINLNKKIALLMGNESRGLKNTSKKLANKKVKIPMQGDAESLNLAMATGIITYEVIRQKMFKG